MTTAKSQRPRVSLILQPGTDTERAIWSGFADLPELKRDALARARLTYGADASFAWLCQETKQLTPVTAPLTLVQAWGQLKEGTA